MGDCAVSGRGRGPQKPDGAKLVVFGLSGFATGASWLCYFRALSDGPVSRVAPIDKLSFVIAVVLGLILFHEKFSWTFAAGVVLIAGGVLLTLKG